MGPSSFFLFCASTGCMLFGETMLLIALQTVGTMLVPANKVGVVTGVSSGFAALGRALSPTLFGFVFEVGASMPFYACSGVMLVAALLCVWIPMKKQNRDIQDI